MKEGREGGREEGGREGSRVMKGGMDQCTNNSSMPARGGWW